MKILVAALLLVSVAAVYGDGGTGDISEIDVNDRNVQKAAQVATASVTQWKNSPFHQLLVGIKSAKAQVVAGILYHLEIEIQESGCPKSEALEGCEAEPSDKFEVCQLKVLSQPWMEVLKVIGDIRCHPVYHL